MSAFIDCPVCGTEKIPPTCSQCSACEIAERYDKQLSALRSSLEAARAEVEALRRFKSYVHQRLDEAGIPTHPDGEHSAHGCRIGDRLDIALTQRAEVAALRALLEESIAWVAVATAHDDPVVVHPNRTKNHAALMAKIRSALARARGGK